MAPGRFCCWVSVGSCVCRGSCLYLTSDSFKVTSVAALENSVLFRDLSSAELNALRWIAQEQRYPAGAQIFQQGDSGFGLYVIKEGAVDIASSVDEGNPHVLSRLGPGEFFGEMAVFDYKPRSAWAVAACDASVYFIPRQEMVNFVQRS